jgi:hypothetical protein
MADLNDIMQRLYAACGSDTGFLFGISPDNRASVRSIVEFTLSQISSKEVPTESSKEFVNTRCRHGLCKIRTHCLTEGRVCASVCQDNPIPNDITDRPLIIVFDDNPTLVKAPDITDVWARQDKRWINLTPRTRTYDINLRIIEKSKFLARKQEGT